MPLKGDTVRFEVNFIGFDGIALDYEPDLVTFKIYDANEVEIVSQVLSDAYKSVMNSYFYDYSIPVNHEGIYFYEFEGLFRGKPYIARDDFNVTF